MDEAVGYISLVSGVSLIRTHFHLQRVVGDSEVASYVGDGSKVRVARGDGLQQTL